MTERQFFEFSQHSPIFVALKVLCIVLFCFFSLTCCSSRSEQCRVVWSLHRGGGPQRQVSTPALVFVFACVVLYVRQKDFDA